MTSRATKLAANQLSLMTVALLLRVSIPKLMWWHMWVWANDVFSLLFVLSYLSLSSYTLLLTINKPESQLLRICAHTWPDGADDCSGEAGKGLYLLQLCKYQRQCQMCIHTLRINCHKSQLCQSPYWPTYVSPTYTKPHDTPSISQSYVSPSYVCKTDKAQEVEREMRHKLLGGWYVGGRMAW